MFQRLGELLQITNLMPAGGLTLLGLVVRSQLRIRERNNFAKLSPSQRDDVIRLTRAHRRRH